MKIDPKKAFVVVLSALLFNSGCMNRRAIVKDTFLLEAKRDNAVTQKASDRILSVQPFSIAPAFEGKGVVSRVGENQYESDFYTEYFVSPARMITEQTRNWLSGSGLFAQILSPVSSVEPAYVLEGHVQQMFMDIRNPTAPKAVFEITFFLLQQQSRNRIVQFHKTYESTQPMKSAFFEDYMAAQSRCLRDILEKLESDLASHL